MTKDDCVNTAPRITVSQQYLDQLEQAKQELTALQMAGVDNWEGYDYAMECIRLTARVKRP